MSVDEFELTGRTALITGGGRGLGKGIALALAEAGADVAVAALTPAGVERTAEAIEQLGGRGWAFTADATDPQAMDALAERVRAELGVPDILVNCVGEHYPGAVALPLGQQGDVMTSDRWRFIVDLNLTSAYEGCRVFGPAMLARGSGSVLNVSGIASIRARGSAVAYSAAKAALDNFTRALALEWAAAGVRVNAISPGSFPDPEQISAQAYQQREKQAAKFVPLGRVGQLRDVGLLALFLASDAASFITGQVFVVDGGASLV